MDASEAVIWARFFIGGYLVALALMALLALGAFDVVNETTWDRLIAVLGSFQALVVVCAGLLFARPAFAAWGKAASTNL